MNNTTIFLIFTISFFIFISIFVYKIQYETYQKNNMEYHYNDNFEYKYNKEPETNIPWN
jgi:hypothetical protein